MKPRAVTTYIVAGAILSNTIVGATVPGALPPDEPTPVGIYFGGTVHPDMIYSEATSYLAAGTAASDW